MKSSVSARLNADLLDQKYEQWCDDPQSVEPTWSAFFEGFELGAAQVKSKDGKAAAGEGASSVPAEAPAASDHNLNFRGRCVSLVYNYRTLGHTQAQINPLHDAAVRNPRLELSQFGLSDADLDRDATTQFFRGGKQMTLREMLAALEESYSGKIGFEFMHIHNTEVRNWIRSKIEHRYKLDLNKETKTKVLNWVLEAELFEEFLGKKFLGEKRFSLEGGEGLMVLLNTILENSPQSDVKEIELGMAHRGRLNVLRNFLHKSLTTILYEFTPDYVPAIVAGDGDVKYHLGYEKVREINGGEVRLSLAANPSHLEAVNAVTEGKARARQRILGDDGVKTDRKQVLPILIHGDAAFAGQGSVAEVLNLSQLPGYRTGGTIHLIVNNQIGFTTMPEDARSSAYATDVAKMIEAPILHVNGEDPQELLWAAEFALEFRQKFGRDVVIDMYCYRRQGHNETDQAAFTAPHIYRKINSRKPFGQSYKLQLVENGSLTKQEADAVQDNIWNELEDGYKTMRELEEQGDRSKFSGSTAEPQPPYTHAPAQTGISREKFDHIGNVLTTVPEGFNLHPTLAKRFVPRRKEAIEKGEGIDWALAEALAFGSLVMEGNPVRLSGQDCRRGTFSHRHAVFYDGETRERYIPLQNLSGDQAKFCVYNSLLSEAAVLGFDYGYSLGCPNMLVMWEAQFGDFSNGAQVIIDQFISSAESKWQTPSSLVMLLPHGYEGMGPEHSSARLERFLQLCAEKNIQVGNFTTPAQYFHALRRQKRRDFRKPLVLMTPKSLLSRAEAVSKVEDFMEGSCFQEILPDDKVFENPEKVDRIIFCTGKVYYDLTEHRDKAGIDDTAILRVEQLYPYHEDMVKALVSNFPNAGKMVWCQEEPQNMGAWSYIAPRLMQTLQTNIRYSGRRAASSPATGSKAVHKREQKSLVESAFNV
ncbi:2-oxoglutarate dehydrogenase E1 component [Rubritalea squalenifaciens DSM 18772]|uniref:oxoglutarate dehydrogenase (succinyl-transferring) n=1 Tax=Rubritalea squalenifaciens DSM 18772 TaxID=1123071 RepID=A0A1M6HTE8_9BACT|nr:2-oxoglutarate dehydrogenase E1 component [Rubritalea squalenifaciens]SHJ25443.1 2-oxoglutarate dehydrogenase E1 component [Rubritalea squalenifaciens DSM 18772]